MKPTIKVISTLLICGAPIVAQATCPKYQNDTLTLNLPATITVPDSLPVGSVITRQSFNGSAPGFNTFCLLATRWINGRYPNNHNQGLHPTEVPGIGVAIRMTTHNGGNNVYTLHNIPQDTFSGPVSSFTSAEATFYKIGPVTTGIVPPGPFFEQKWLKTSSTFRLQLGNAVRFIRPVATCDLLTGDVNRTITFAPIRASDLRDADFAGLLHFALTANCTNATNVTFRFSGSPAPGNSTLFANKGSAPGVALWMGSIINGHQQTISPNANNVRTVVVAGNRAILPLRAAYHKNGKVGTGTLNSTATVNITYN